MAGFEELVQAGLISGWGVSNFDTPDLDELSAVTGATQAQTDQVLYNLARRGLEHDLLPHCRSAGMPLMAYSPVDHGRLLQHPGLQELASARDVTPAQLALAWVLRLPEVFAVVKASTPARVAENRAAAEIDLSPAELAAARPPVHTAPRQGSAGDALTASPRSTRPRVVAPHVTSLVRRWCRRGLGQ